MTSCCKQAQHGHRRFVSGPGARHQRDIMAIPLTRSNPQGEIGFLSDIRRMNVGMTRARRKLLLVGDSSTLCRHPFFGELLAYVKGVGGFRTAQEMVKET